MTVQSTLKCLFRRRFKVSHRVDGVPRFAIMIKEGEGNVCFEWRQILLGGRKILVHFEACFLNAGMSGARTQLIYAYFSCYNMAGI